MIDVEKLEKHYGATRALGGVTFQVPRGQVLGFLGPNGAGKTTTMKILTGFLHPDGGRATIAGFDVLEQPLQTRRLVGYLPESNPLYTEMSVLAYLRFVADIRGVESRHRTRQVEKVAQECGLERVIGKDVGELSKGYRQRVGLAQAMIHDPEVLILDEPTSGLDPNQIVEIRTLVKKIGQSRTVILSTHYLQEVEATCDRVIIIHQGEIVADGSIPDLTAGEKPGPLRLGVAGPADKVRARLQELVGPAGVEEAGQHQGAAHFRLLGLPADFDAGVLCDLLVTRNQWRIVELHREAPHLEVVFRRLTGGLEEPVAAGADRQGGGR